MGEDGRTDYLFIYSLREPICNLETDETDGPLSNSETASLGVQSGRIGQRTDLFSLV